VGAIKDAAFLTYIRANAEAIRRRTPEGCRALEEVVRRCAELHLEHIRTSGDAFESGSARPLDFGHWAAHKIETMTHYGIGHGQAVGMGIALDAYCALRTGHIEPAGFRLITDALAGCGLPLFHPCMLERKADGALRILQGLDDFREHLGGILCVTLPSPLGRKTEVNQVDPALVEEAVEQLRHLAAEVGGTARETNCAQSV
jgi:3-dehydroquinate synthase